PGEEHGRLGRRHSSCLLERREERRRVGDDARKVMAVVERGPERLHTYLQLPRSRLGGTRPLLLLGETLMLDGDDQRRGDGLDDSDEAIAAALALETGRAHLCTPVTWPERMPATR